MYLLWDGMVTPFESNVLIRGLEGTKEKEIKSQLSTCSFELGVELELDNRSVSGLSVPTSSDRRSLKYLYCYLG